MSPIHDWERADAATAGFIVPPGEGGRVPTKPTAKRKTDSRNTAGVVLVDEARLLPGDKIPPHRHDNIAEVFYVLEGEIVLQIGDQIVRAVSGTCAFSPVGNVHGFSNLSAAPARLLIVCLPPTSDGAHARVIERYFEAMERLPAGAPLSVWERVGREHGVEGAGPPLEEASI